MWGETNQMNRQLTYTMESEKKRQPGSASRNYCETESSGNINTRMNTCDCNCYQSRLQNSNLKQQPTFDYLTDLQRLNLDISQMNNNNKMANKSLSYSNSTNAFNNSNRKIKNQSYINNDSFLFSKYTSQIPEQNIKRNDISIQENDSMMKTMPNTNNSGRKTLSNLTINKINKIMNDSILKKLKCNNPQRKFNSNINNPQSIFSHYASSIPQGGSNFIHGSNLKTFNNSNSLFDSDKKISDQPIEEGIENQNNNETDNINNQSINNDQEKDLMSFKTIDEFNAYLKEENYKLKKTTFAYKQLIDTLFYFVNSLSHKYSYNKAFFEIAYYVEHLDELTKSLLDLDKYISNTIDLSVLEKKHQEFLSSLKITNEFQLTLPIVSEEKYKEKTLPTNKHHPIYSFGGDEEMKSDSKDNKGKDGRDCVACLLGASVSQRGYSPMKCNPYKRYNTNDRILSPNKSLSHENSRSHSRNGHSKGKTTPRKNLKLVNS